MKKNFETFCQMVNSYKTPHIFDACRRGETVINFQTKGFSNDMVRRFWNRYKRQNGAGGFSFTVESACLIKY